MRVCDRCRNEGVKDIRIQVQEANAKRRNRTIIEIPVELCDSCVTLLCRDLGCMKKQGTITNPLRILTEEKR